TLQGFNGEQTDPVTGWQFLGAGHRVYNPGQRCFTSEDPAGGGYAFGSNNPIMNTDPSGNIPHWLGNVFGALNYAGTLGFAALHRRWAMITGTAVMMGLSIVTTVATLVAEGAPPLLTAATAGYAVGINGIFVASAATPNKGFNIAGAIIGGIDAAVTLATASIGIASAGDSWVKRIMNVETDGIITGRKTRRVVMELRHFVEDDDKGRIPVGKPPPLPLFIKDRDELNSIWSTHFSKNTQEMTYVDIPSLLGIAYEMKQPIDKELLDDLILAENRVKVNLITKEVYYDEVEAIAKYFGNFNLYNGVDLENVLPPDLGAVVIGYMAETGKRFTGYLIYYPSFGSSETWAWRKYQAFSRRGNSYIRFRHHSDKKLMGDDGPLKVTAIMYLHNSFSIS
ncbi:MAG: RHS repeat-associated core domain-containing protein, partial [Endozoicomonadaceae bacterium]|nr:RHS repeat-associated core domain-containing protein [Endozoicomonadaceae bacterium]